MPDVHFEIHRLIGSEVEELDEGAIAARLAVDPQFLAALCDLEALEGAIVIEGAAILDELPSAVQRLCFESVIALVTPGAQYDYRYFTANQRAELEAGPASITLRGDDVPPREVPREALLPALLACGERFLQFVARLGEGGRAGSADELAHLQGFATRARAALAAAGLV